MGPAGGIPVAGISGSMEPREPSKVTEADGSREPSKVTEAGGSRGASRVTGAGGHRESSATDGVRGRMGGQDALEVRGVVHPERRRAAADHPDDVSEAGSKESRTEHKHDTGPDRLPHPGGGGHPPTEAGEAAGPGPASRGRFGVGLDKIDRRVGLYMEAGGQGIGVARRERMMNPEDEKEYTAALRKIKGLVMYYFNQTDPPTINGGELTNLEIGLRSGTITFNDKDGNHQFITAHDLYTRIYDPQTGRGEGTPETAESIEVCLDKMWRIAKRHGARGSRIPAYSPGRGSMKGEKPLEALAQGSDVVKKLPHAGARLDSFIKPTEKKKMVVERSLRHPFPSKTETDKSTLQELVALSEDPNNPNDPAHRRRVVKELVRGEAFHRHLIRKIDSQCQNLQGEIDNPASPLTDVGKKEKKKQLQKYQGIKRQLEQNVDSFAYHAANIQRMQLRYVYGAEGPSLEQAFKSAQQMEEKIKRVLATKEGINPFAQSEWFATPEGKAAAAYARETAGLIFTDPRPYAEWCYRHDVPPHQPGITSFLHGCCEWGADAADYTSLQMGMGTDDPDWLDPSEITEMGQWIYDSHDTGVRGTFNACVEVVGDKDGIHPITHMRAEYASSTADEQMAAILKNEGMLPPLDILRP